MVVPVKIASRKVLQKPWPVLQLSDWVKACFEHYGGMFLLGGHTLTNDNLKDIHNMLERFWQRYQHVQDVDVAEPSRTIPWMLHGDEGRGQCKSPVLICSFQPVIGWMGEEHINSKKNLGQSQLALPF